LSIKKYSRTNPFLTRIKERSLLTGPSSTKKTYHIALEVERDQFPYKVGDSIGILPQNDPEEVDAILKKLGCSGSETIFDPRENATAPVRDILMSKVNISRVHAPFFRALRAEDPLLLPENKTRLTEFLHTHTLLDLLGLHSLQDLSSLTKLMPLLPRFYSIANSAHVFPDEIHLTVAYVTYVTNGQVRKGIGSYFLCSYAKESITPIPIYLQPSNHFTLPDDPAASIILVGPGTGVAPFRAFLQERLALNSSGRNWLFFGERNRASDFYYESFFKEIELAGRLRLDLAFSRDTAEKTYVQHKMYEERKSLWAWLQEGAYFYVCGDAEEMAKDVDAMFHRIVREVGGLTEEDARHYIKRLRAEKRYLTDVY
jgi:sulfite reductase (NADPH) flavoprotein alpha-component